MNYKRVSGSEMGDSDFTVVTSGVDRVRVLWSFPDDSPPTSSTFVYDGDRILAFGDVEIDPYSLYEPPEKHPEEYDLVSMWVFPQGSDEFERACPGARTVGTKKIAGRVALGYRCDTKEPPLGPGPVWLDQESGQVLQAGDLVAEKVTADPTVDAETFSTEPPEGAKVEVVPPPK